MSENLLKTGFDVDHHIYRFKSISGFQTASVVACCCNKSSINMLHLSVSHEVGRRMHLASFYPHTH